MIENNPVNTIEKTIFLKEIQKPLRIESISNQSYSKKSGVPKTVKFLSFHDDKKFLFLKCIGKYDKSILLNSKTLHSYLSFILIHNF